MENSKNILSGLNVPSQVPLDTKTYKLNLSDITSVSTEQAYTYYTGMRVDVAENNIQYVWKEVLESNEQEPVSNTFTYPNNFTVNGFNYSNKTFAFYEVLVHSDEPTPEPDRRIIYRTEIFNLPMPGLQEYRTSWGTLFVRKEVDVNPTSDNYKNENFYFRPLASTTLRFGVATEPSPFDPNNINPLWIDYFPSSKGELVVVETEEEILQAIEDGKDTVVIKPTPTIEGPVIKFPNLPIIDKDLSILVPWDGKVIVKGPIVNAPIFKDASGKIKFDLGKATELDFKNTKLAEGTPIEIVGGIIKANDLTAPFIKGGREVSFTDTILDLSNATLVESGVNTKITIDKSKIVSQNEALPVFKVTDNSVTKFKNTDFALSGSLSPFLLAEGNSVTELTAVNMEGNVNKVFAVAQGNESFSPSVSINNSDLGKLTSTALFSGINHDEGIVVDKLKVNNTLFLNEEILSNSVEGFKNTATIVDGSNTGTDSGGDMLKSENLAGLTNYDVALTNLGVYSKGQVDQLIEESGGTGDVTKSYVDNADNALSNRIESLEQLLPVDLSAYEKITDNNNKLAQKADLDVFNSLTQRVEALEAQAGLNLQRFPSRAVARDNGIQDNGMFINTNNNNEDKTTWKIDVVIL